MSSPRNIVYRICCFMQEDTDLMRQTQKEMCSVCVCVLILLIWQIVLFSGLISAGLICSSYIQSYRKRLTDTHQSDAWLVHNAQIQDVGLLWNYICHVRNQMFLSQKSIQMSQKSIYRANMHISKHNSSLFCENVICLWCSFTKRLLMAHSFQSILLTS